MSNEEEEAKEQSGEANFGDIMSYVPLCMQRSSSV